MSSFNSRWLDFAPPTEQGSDTPKNTPSKTDKSPQPTPPPESPDAETLPRLPWQLERLISAACADVLPQDPMMLPSGLVPNLNRYTLGWAAAYLTSDRQEALSRLWQVRRVWQGETPS